MQTNLPGVTGFPCDLQDATPETLEMIARASAAGWQDIRITRSTGFCGWSGIPPIPGLVGFIGSHGVKHLPLSQHVTASNS